jgi:hypothetical protein
MTKISELADIGSGLAGDDVFIIQDISDSITPTKKITASGIRTAIQAAGSPNGDITIDTTPFIWRQLDDTYYEYTSPSTLASFSGPSNAGAGYVTQPDLRIQSGMRRVGLHASGFVNYYLDGADSTFFAGEWLRIYEGENKCGNGTTNNYIRKGLSTWASGTTYAFGNRTIFNGVVWECLRPTLSGVAPASGIVTATGVINMAASGNVMVEIPEFFVRIDWDDGQSWKNCAGADVSSTYRALTTSGDTVVDPLRVYYVLRKQEYDALGVGEQRKWIRHPAFWASGDTTQQCTVYIDGTTPTVFEPSPYTTLRDASGVTRVWNGSAFGYYTSSGTATTSGSFNPATAIRYRYMPAYQGTTDGTKLQSITASGVYTSHTRATGLTRARTIASGWANGDYALWNACQLLTAMEYRNFFIQSPTVGIGRGRDNYNDLLGYRDYQLGLLNNKGNTTFNNTTDGRNSTAGSDNGAAMQWRGVEHYYAGSWRWIHGINVNAGANGQIYLALNPDRFVNDTTANYINSNLRVSTASDGVYIGGFRDQAGLFFFPDEGGTASTYVTDIRYGTYGTSGWRVLAVGGGSDSGAFCGPWLAYFAVGSLTAGGSFGSLLSR